MLFLIVISALSKILPRVYVNHLQSMIIILQNSIESPKHFKCDGATRLVLMLAPPTLHHLFHELMYCYISTGPKF